MEKAISVVYEKLESWVDYLISMLPNLAVAVIVLIIFHLIGVGLKSTIYRVLNRFSNRVAVNNLFASLVHLVAIVIGLIIALNVLQLQQTVLSLLAGIGIIGLTLGFAFQDITANFIAGVMLAFKRPIEVGDIIENQNFLGTVERIDLRVTIIRTFQGLHVIIPNKQVFQEPVINLTKTPERRIDLDVRVSYAENLRRVKQVAEQAIGRIPFLVPGKPVEAHFHEFDSSCVRFTMMFWIEYPNNPGYPPAVSEAIMTLKEAFEEHRITIPYPIRTLDFGIKGGESLSEVPLSIKNGKVTDDH